MNRPGEGNEINRIEKRAIEALAIVPLLEAVSERIGQEEARALLRKVNEQEAFRRGQSMRGPQGENGIEALVAEVATWGDGGVWEAEVLEQTETTYFFDVARCPYHEKYRELGLEEYGVEFSCCRDDPHARGFNPQLKLVRTKTLMAGDDCCDFRYYLQAE